MIKKYNIFKLVYSTILYIYIVFLIDFKILSTASLNFFQLNRLHPIDSDDPLLGDQICVQCPCDLALNKRSGRIT